MALTPGQILAAVAPIVGKAGAAGIAGNGMQESNNTPGRAGGGWLQWQGARQAALQSYAQAHGLDPNSGAAALGYLVQDLKGPYAGLAAQLRRTNDPGKAAVLFSNQYERPSIPMLGNRIRYAQAAYGATPGSVLVPGMKPAKGQRATTMGNTIGGGVNTQAAAVATLRQEANRQISSGPATGNPLAEYQHELASGQFNVPTAHTSQPGQPTSGSLRQGTLHPLTGRAGNTNPLGSGWSIGRTDMGVDAHAAVGTPIHAINDSRVVSVVPNWYSGQPLVMMQLTAGPDKGKYWYVAEQISHVPHVGQRFAAGDTVVRYAPSGTGIEIGWGAPGGRTQAQATTGYHEGEVTPAGANFAHTILGR